MYFSFILFRKKKPATFRMDKNLQIFLCVNLLTHYLPLVRIQLFLFLDLNGKLIFVSRTVQFCSFIYFVVSNLLLKKNFQALAKQEKIDYEEQIIKEREHHEKIAAERAQARYKKHYSICWEVVNQIIDLSTQVGEYRLLTNK